MNLQIPLAATLNSCKLVSPPIKTVGYDATAVSFFVVRYSAGKSPKGECFILGRSLLSDALNGLFVDAVSNFFK